MSTSDSVWAAVFAVSYVEHLERTATALVGDRLITEEDQDTCVRRAIQQADEMREALDRVRNGAGIK